MRIKKRPYSKTLNLSLLFVLFIQDIQAISPLHIVGSSAVFPFAASVAEHFGHKSRTPIPLIESIGTGAGIKLFCGSTKGPDGVITSRAMTTGEINVCKNQGIHFEEFKIGQDGLVLIQNKQEVPFSLTLSDLRKALSEKILEQKKCIPNPTKTWNDIQNTFPNIPIRVLGPAPTSGTYDVLIEKMGTDCASLLRHDGAYIEAPANENLIIQKALNATSTIGIITFSFYEQNWDRLRAVPINNILPSVSTIQQGRYPLSRPLYLYIRTDNIQNTPARIEYALEFMSQDAIGKEGYLNAKGLIPLSLSEQEKMRQRAFLLQQMVNP
ncbi:MAG: substrate-binding domain-containing protein [Proteobacteria bacterium]|nr:substrate-binding domain-containing protein [Pseudomonadota bacterium]